MNRKSVISILVLGALAIAAAFGAVAYRSASAANAAVTGLLNRSSFLSQGFAPDIQADFGRGPGGEYSKEDLAAALGISVDELTAAYLTANQAAIDQAVAQGLITQAQADQLEANGSAFPMGGNWKGYLSQNGIDYQALLADALGISVEQLQEAKTTAFNSRIDQAVTDGKLTQEQADLMKGEHGLYANEKFQTSMQSAFESAVNQAVTDGVITQAQADQILQNRANFGLGGMGGGHRGGHGMGGFEGRGGFDGFGTSPDSQAPATVAPGTNG